MTEIDLLEYLKKPNKSCQVSSDSQFIYIKFNPYCVSPYIDLRSVGKPVEIEVCSDSDDATIILSHDVGSSGQFIQVYPCNSVVVPTDKAVVWFSGPFNTSMKVRRYGIIVSTPSPPPPPTPPPPSTPTNNENKPLIPEVSTGTLVIAGLVGVLVGVGLARVIR